MRNNLPVSDIEYIVPAGAVFVSKTDLRGVITYGNRDFCEISGFLESELLGEPHNIVRHPDVPQRIFADCWKGLANGKIWHGVIKNRRKNGDYYWIDANISPLIENGQHIGYLSLRYKASPEQIAEAERHYSSLRGWSLPALFRAKQKDDYIAKLQQQLADKIMKQEHYLDSHEQEQRIASRYMNKLIAQDKLRDPAVRFYLKPAANFSGDLIAIARTPDNRLHLLLADSTGHGLSAALAAMPMIHPFYSMTGKGFTIPAIAMEINHKVRESLPSSHFVAAILVSIDTASQMIEVWSGGCPPPLILDEQGNCVYRFKPRHLAMGILTDEQFDTSVEYFSYDNNAYSLLMFSDGVTELENEHKESFGIHGLLDAARIEDFDARTQNIVHAIESHCRTSASSIDDIALMMAQFKFDGRRTTSALQPPEKNRRQLFRGAVIWQFALTLSMQQIKKLDVVPLLLDIVQQVEKDGERSGEIFMILSEMFNNALDHGVLKLDSRLKHHEDGLERYFEERALRLNTVETGQIQLHLEKVSNTDGSTFLRIRVKDSGNGFDHRHCATQCAEGTARHGRGIPLLYNVCRSVRFFGNGSEVEVEFNLPQETR